MVVRVVHGGKRLGPTGGVRLRWNARPEAWEPEK